MTSLRLFIVASAIGLTACFSPGVGLHSGSDGGSSDGGVDNSAAPDDAGQGDGGSRSDAGLNGDGGRPAGQVQCGAAVCGASEVCVALYEPQTATVRSPTCYPRTAEPPFSAGSIRAYCDSHEDCAPAEKCVHQRGEEERFRCVAESGECYIHATHLCGSSADCHSCQTGNNSPTVYTCKPATPAHFTHLQVCQL